MSLRHGSFFTGIGGFDIAAQRVGWENVFHCEIDDFNRQILKHHFPNATSHADIRDFDGKPYADTIDIVSGGFSAKIFPLPKPTVVRKASKAPAAVSGKNMGVLFGKLDLESSSLKTAQCSLGEDSRSSYATLPSSGIMLNGDVFMLPSSDSHIYEKGSMEWPTPCASDGAILLKTVESYERYYRNQHQDQVVYQCQLNGLTATQTIHVYEWMMGFPKNWTSVE